MKLFNFFRKKAHKAILQSDPDPIENYSDNSEETKGKILYNADTSLLEVLNYIKDYSSQIGIQLNSPATDIEISAFENQKIELPEDFKLLYKLSNGFETDQDLFRLIPLNEIIENGLDKSYLVSDSSFHFTEYMIYSDMWSVDISKENVNDYRIYNKADTVIYLTNSLAEFLCVFINKGIYDGLYEWREMKQKLTNNQ